MENHLKARNRKRKLRVKRIRKGVCGSSTKPRLSVFRSNDHLYAQIIDDQNSKTLFGIGTTSKEVKNKKKGKEAAKEIGKLIAASAKKNKIEHVVFDRGHYKYHGIIAELANAARKEGLKI